MRLNMEPATIDDLGTLYRRLAWEFMRRALKDRNNRKVYPFWLGNANMAINVLSSISHPSAYRALARYNMVWRICENMN